MNVIAGTRLLTASPAQTADCASSRSRGRSRRGGARGGHTTRRRPTYIVGIGEYVDVIDYQHPQRIRVPAGGPFKCALVFLRSSLEHQHRPPETVTGRGFFARLLTSTRLGARLMVVAGDSWSRHYPRTSLSATNTTAVLLPLSNSD